MKFSRIIVALVLCILLLSGVGCELLGGTEATPTPTPTATANTSPNVSPLTTDYGASLLPAYDQSSDRIYFSVTAYAKEPVNLYIYDPDNREIGEIYVPPKVEKAKISEGLYLPPVPSDGMYRLIMLSELTGQLVWQNIQTFNGPDLWVLDYSLNPVWERGAGWDLQHLTMTLINKGDMPVTLNGLKLRLEKEGSPIEEITLAQAGADVEYGWKTEARPRATSDPFANRPGVVPGTTRYSSNIHQNPTYRDAGKVSPTANGSLWRWVLPPWEKAGDGVVVVPYGSTKQNLFGHYFNPGEYQLSIELSGFLWVLEEKELNFEQNPGDAWGILPDSRP